jgi:hypothetical protein
MIYHYTLAIGGVRRLSLRFTEDHEDQRKNFSSTRNATQFDTVTVPATSARYPRADWISMHTVAICRPAHEVDPENSIRWVR